ncbi:MAG: hypothetical protein HUU50_18725 [Candidatus Brocadiae bacterium]|nr:hypothetical protein [Candidatus Brocadiia bacterium]
MIKKVDLGQPLHGVFGNPAPLGLLGLAVSCAALLPVAMGFTITKSALITSGTFVLFFGFACHLLTGLMEFANRNTYGGTIFTAFAFNWLITGLSLFGLAFGFMPDHQVILATEIVLFIIFLFLTYGFGFFSKLLFYFLLDIDFMYVCKIIKSSTGTNLMDWPVAIFTAILGLIGLWLSLAGLINPIAGKEFFKLGKPLFRTPAKNLFDFSLRRAIFDALYAQWKEHAFQEMPLEKLREIVQAKNKNANIIPDLFYLMEYGALKLTCVEDKIKSIRLTASGIDLHEQLVLKKYSF